MSTIPTIRDLSDYPAVKKLAAALHRLDASRHGAAIMIGAGFTRSAARHVDGQKKAPLWTQFTQNLAQDLYSDDQSLSFMDPLRVAEEYRAYFGQAALNDRIRFEIDNDAWRTGSLYRTLLELPWTEVLTTNWDTLLEQAAGEIHSPYYTSVTKTSDLAWAQSPRIVKLHGTIGITDAFIAAQEDYRTYPEKYAPFVNLARQVFIENELCLLGFSGDDPNFIQWAGWVRDHLANHARKIYLVGALNLSSARRKQLESINVAPVDLWPLVAHLTDRDLMHERAIEIFLQALMDEEKSKPKPHEWTPTSLQVSVITAEDHNKIYHDPEYGATLLASQIKTLQQDRESYPGWVVCPPSVRWRLENQINIPWPNAKNLAALSGEDREKLLYEIAWRYGLACKYISPWLHDTLFEVVKLHQPCVLSKRQQLEIAVVLLNNTRWLQANNEDKRETIDEHSLMLIDILEKDASYLPDCIAEVANYRALVARDSLDYDRLSVVVQHIVGEDPMWKLRKAAFLMDLGRPTEAMQLIAKTYGDLRESHRRDQLSIPVLSRLVWAHWLLGASQSGGFQEKSEDLPKIAENNYRKWKCDPWSWIDDLRRDIGKRREKYLERRQPIEPKFEQGHYQDHSDDVSTDSGAEEFFLLDGLSRVCGIPLRANTGAVNISLLASDAEKLVLSGGSSVELWDRTLAIRAASSESSASITELFSRTSVACASQDVADVLVLRVLSAISYWRKRRSLDVEPKTQIAISRLRVFLEILARLTVRVTSLKAQELFLFAVSLGQQSEFQHPWLSETLGDLLVRAIKSVPYSEQAELLPSSLIFPLQRETHGGDIPRWPNPVIYHPGERKSDVALDSRISYLIEAVASSDGNSKFEPLLRLLPLAQKSGFLNETERQKLSIAIWGDPSKKSTLPITGLFPHALMLLPSNGIDVGTLVRAELYEPHPNLLADTQHELRSYPSPEVQRAISIFESMASAAEDDAIKLLPTAEQALALFDELVAWRPPTEQRSQFGFFENIRKGLAESVGRAISYAIAPALAPDMRTAARLIQLKSFYVDVAGALTALPAFVYFSTVDTESAKVVAKLIQMALRSRDANQIIYGALAIEKWKNLPNSISSPEFAHLVSTVISIIESGRTIGLPQLLQLSGELLKEDRLSQEQAKTLADIIPIIFDAADYKNLESNSIDAISASTIRAECARLAQKLLRKYPEDFDLSALIDRSKIDSLPEVRFALNALS